ncbi:uncharacterized protein [Clytia hemisphaerica]|uniref:Uncharacterized protein n=1 Tax=Clytia hemisphaerica TaxID=252671 RepID=A0A7M5X256_9CNID|eukprot:TCONS_00006409-protein
MAITLIPCEVQDGIKMFWSNGGFRHCQPNCDPKTGYWADTVPCRHCCLQESPVDPPEPGNGDLTTWLTIGFGLLALLVVLAIAAYLYRTRERRRRRGEPINAEDPGVGDRGNLSYAL